MYEDMLKHCVMEVNSTHSISQQQVYVAKSVEIKENGAPLSTRAGWGGGGGGKEKRPYRVSSPTLAMTNTLTGI